MEKNARLFNCLGCHQQTLVCGCCDRGNIYCGPACSKAARKASLLAAGRRYQNTYGGKLKHAARQRRYRACQKEKVTHQGSGFPLANDLLAVEPGDPFMPPMQIRVSQHKCHFCHKRCSNFVRLGFMQSHSPVQTQRKTSWPHGP